MVISILTSTKNQLGVAATDTSFDEEIITHINSCFTSLSMLGLPNADSFSITDDTAVWSDIIPPPINQNHIKTYIYLRVKLLFDPPQNGFLVTSLDKQIEKLESMIYVQSESVIVV